KEENKDSFDLHRKREKRKRRQNFLRLRFRLAPKPTSFSVRLAQGVVATAVLETNGLLAADAFSRVITLWVSFSRSPTSPDFRSFRLSVSGSLGGRQLVTLALPTTVKV